MMAGAMRFTTYPGLVVPNTADIEVDEPRNIDWRSAWLKELAQLQQVTAEHDEAHTDPEWYKMMLFSVRSALMLPPGDPIVRSPDEEQQRRLIG